MSCNRYQPHVMILPEDDANRQIANGFCQHLSLKEKVIQILPPADGWKNVLDQFIATHISELNNLPHRRLVLLIDFDNRLDRLQYFQRNIPDLLCDRVFVIGVFTNPENLRSDLKMSFEQIGETLANHCVESGAESSTENSVESNAESSSDLWNHELLRHNNSERERMCRLIREILFPKNSVPL